MIIDAHQHFWDPARGDYDWLTPDSPLFRTFTPQDLAPNLAEHGVEATIAVQAAPTVAETDYLLALSEHSSSIAGVVGWVDLESDGAAEAIEKRSACRSFVGIRPMLQDLADRAWILRPELSGGIEATSEAGLVFDALIRSDQLRVVERLAGQHPSLTIMVDHAAKPPLGRNREMETWLIGLAGVAAYPNACCKLSGLLTELPSGSGLDAIPDVIGELLSLFGAERLVWGSDWPVLTLAGDYASWFDLCRRELERHGHTVADAVMGDNARRIYKLTA